MMKKWLSIVLLLTLSLSLWCAAAIPASAGHYVGLPVENGFQYLLNEDGSAALITDYYGPDPDMVIPATIAGASVTGIDVHAFAGTGHEFITGITIPASVTTLGFEAFSGCSGLTSLTVDSGNPVYYSDGNCIIETEIKAVVLGCQNSVIPTDGSVTRIGNDAFGGCKALTGITIPNTVTSIGRDAFAGCTALTSLTIPDSVTEIGSSAFYGCTALADVTVPDSVTYIGESAFEGTAWYAAQPDGVVYIGGIAYTYKGDHKPTELVLRDGTVSIADNAFAYLETLTSVTMPDSVTHIGEGAFEGCGALTDAAIPNGVTEIEDSTFWGTAITDLYIPASVTRISEWAFVDCASLMRITADSENPVYHSVDSCLVETATGTLVVGARNSIIPTDGSVTAIGNQAFSGRELLTRIELPNGVTSIGENAFSRCIHLKTVTMPDTVTRIGDSAFAACLELSGIRIPDGVTSIENWAFLNCEALMGVAGAKNVTRIGDSAFFGCESLVHFSLPNGLTSIGDNAFAGCTSWKYITLPDTLTEIGNYAFIHDTFTHITIPAAVTRIGSFAFGFCSNLTRIVLPAGLTDVDGQAFYQCGSLKTVYYGGTEADRDDINIKADNTALTNATWVYEATELLRTLGDANGDGAFDMKDVLALRIAIARIIGYDTGIDAEMADMDRDGGLSMKDVLTMRKMIAGLLPVSD